MNLLAFQEKLCALLETAPVFNAITTAADYDLALNLMDRLAEDDARDKPLIVLLSNAIGEWEKLAEECAEVKNASNVSGSRKSVLKAIMDLHGLKASDLSREIGSKSLVSLILSGRRNLTVRHIESLSKRFGVPYDVFFKHKSK